MAQPSVHGRFIWQELMSADTAAATSYYSRIIGWRVQAPVHPSSDYHVFAAESGSVGGVMPLSEEARKMGARPHWLPYIGAANVDDTVADAEQRGGKVLRPAEDIENLGRYAVLADPQGAAFGIYRPQHPAASSVKSQPQRGEFGWQELATSDHEAAFRFYSELFGWEALQRMDMGPVGTYLVFGRDGVQQGGIYKLSAQTPAPYWLSYVEVPDTNAVAEVAREAGGQITNGPMDVPGGGRIAQLLDPGGVLFAIHTAAEAAPARPSRRARPAAAKSATGESAARVSVAGEPTAARKVARKAAKKSVASAKKSAAKRSAPKKSAPKKSAAKKSATTKRAQHSTRARASSRSAGAAGMSARRRSGAAASARRGASARTRGKAPSSTSRTASAGSRGATVRGAASRPGRRSVRAKVPVKAARRAAKKSARRR